MLFHPICYRVEYLLQQQTGENPLNDYTNTPHQSLPLLKNPQGDVCAFGFWESKFRRNFKLQTKPETNLWSFKLFEGFRSKSYMKTIAKMDRKLKYQMLHFMGKFSFLILGCNWVPIWWPSELIYLQVHQTISTLPIQKIKRFLIPSESIWIEIELNILHNKCYWEP